MWSLNCKTLVSTKTLFCILHVMYSLIDESSSFFPAGTHFFSPVSTYFQKKYDKSGCFTPNKGHEVNISTDKQYLNSHPRVQTVSSIMFKDLGSTEHGGVTQLEMWRYLAIWAGSHWSWDNTNSVSVIVLMQVFSTSHKCYSVQTRVNGWSHLPSHHCPLSVPPLWHTWHRTSPRACHGSPSGSCPQVTSWCVGHRAAPTSHQWCVCRRYSQEALSVTPLIPSPSVTQHQQGKGGGTPHPVGLSCTSPPQFASVPAKLYFYLFLLM